MDNSRDIAAQNAEVKQWFTTTMQEVKTRYMQLIHSPNRSGDGLDSLKYVTKATYGEIDQGGFKFLRYLVYPHKAAGKGFGGAKGSVWFDKDGNKKRTNPASLGKIGSGTRRKEEWLNPVLDTQVPKLADIVKNFKADLAVKQIQIK